YEIVRLLYRRAEHETGVTARGEAQRGWSVLEYGEFLERHGLAARAQRALVAKDPCHVVPGRRLVFPALAVFQAHVEVVDAGRRANRALRLPVAAEDDAHRPLFRDILRRDILAFGRSVLFRRRQRDP